MWECGQGEGGYVRSLRVNGAIESGGARPLQKNESKFVSD